MLNFMKTGLALTGILLLAACGKEMSVDTLGNTGNTNTSSGKLRMTINGKVWIADRIAEATITDDITAIYGISYDKKAFIITLDATSTGEFTLDQNSLHVAAWTDSTETNNEAYTTNQSEDQVKAGGKVYVTKIDTVQRLISGTFELKLFRELDNGQKTIIDGVFENLSYGSTPTTIGGGTGPGGPIQAGNSLQATINGSNYKPTDVSGFLFQDKIIVNGAQTDGSKALGLQFPANIIAGTYNFDFIGGYVGLYNHSLNEPYLASSGKLTITEHDTVNKKIKGSFNFTGEVLQTGATKAITNGSFSISYK
ncbi:DUF6252 domain-containing protein [Flavitalea sp.]|nr:DUF6252 family protein [Flavitalea sp.]